MLVTLFFSLLQASSRSEYLISSIDRHCQEIHWLKRRCVTDHDWSWKSQNKCDKRRDVNAKTEEEVRRQRIYEKITRMRILNENLVENLDLDRMQKTSEYLYEKSIDFSSKQKQSDIDFAEICCFKLLEFELFEFLLIDEFWLIADIETEYWRIDDWQRVAKKASWFDHVADLLSYVLQLFFSCHCSRIAAVM